MGWTRFFRRQHWDDERARELQTYFEHEVDDNIARGMTPVEARHAARRKLGNATLVREEIYDMNTIAFLETAWRDLRYGARLLRRNPTFAIVAILTLALGTGANAAIFQLVDAVRLRTLPVVNPHELVEITIETHGKGRTGGFMGRRPMQSNVLWERIRDSQQAFSSVMAWSPQRFDLADGGEVRPAEGLWVSGTFFDTLGVRASRGRLIGPADDVRGCASPGVVLSDAFWRREYGGDPGVLQRTILIDGHRFDVIGVTAPGFFGVEVGRSFDVAIPLCADPILRGERTRLDRGDQWFLSIFGRLKPDWTLERAAAQLKAMSPAIFKETLPARYVPEDARSYLAFLFKVDPAGAGVSNLRQAYSTPLWILLGVTGLVLLVTCANLANLMLARATAREREIGIRLAIGASRRRIVRQMLSESLLLAVVGAAVGLLVARWLSGFLVVFLSTDQNPLFLDLAFDWRIFAFTALIASAACLLFGLAPALRATGSSPAVTVLGGRGATDGRERFTLRRTLVVIQVAVSLVLLVGALLFARSLRNLMAVDPGFRQDGVLVVNLDLQRANVAPENRRELYDAIVERLKAVPGVDGAAEAAIAPISGNGWNQRIVVDGKVQDGAVNFNAVSPGYFQTLATPIVKGRDFTLRDNRSSVPVAIVNELFVKKHLGGGDAIGRRFHIEDSPGEEPQPRYEIVGVVADTYYNDLREERVPITYVPVLQEREIDPFLQVVLHSSIGIGGVTPAVSRVIQEFNPTIAVQFTTMERLVTNSLTSERLMAALSGFFGGLAVLIATVGLYGVMSYMVARRRMEIGIRMALGADRGTVVRLVVSDAGRLLAVGLLVGVPLAILAARTARTLLYGLQPWDPITLTLGALTLGGVALVASWLPAYRASRVAPTAALRDS
jgi:predicted permease